MLQKYINPTNNHLCEEFMQSNATKGGAQLLPSSFYISIEFKVQGRRISLCTLDTRGHPILLGQVVHPLETSYILVHISSKPMVDNNS